MKGKYPDLTLGRTFCVVCPVILLPCLFCLLGREKLLSMKPMFIDSFECPVSWLNITYKLSEIVLLSCQQGLAVVSNGSSASCLSVVGCSVVVFLIQWGACVCASFQGGDHCHWVLMALGVSEVSLLLPFLFLVFKKKNKPNKKSLFIISNSSSLLPFALGKAPLVSCWNFVHSGPGPRTWFCPLKSLHKKKKKETKQKPNQHCVLG